MTRRTARWIHPPNGKEEAQVHISGVSRDSSQGLEGPDVHCRHLSAAEVGPGDLVIIPAGKKFQHKLTKIGDEPVNFLLSSTTPPFDPKDITWVEQ